MYEQHFGFKKRPFNAKVAGTDVFVGPQTATTMAHLKKALQSQDAVIAVSGPAGVGKTTLAAKALQAIAATHKSIRIGRMHLQGTDVLEFLLEELGVKDLPRGPIRQFTALRERLKQLEGENTRVVVVIEDAVRIGAESLAELEALTASDAGDSGGAAIILLGDSQMNEFLGDTQLARVAQRVRQRHSISPLCAAEMRGYLMHCFRLAGVDFEHIFESGTSNLVHELCGGVPRIANNVVDSVLSAAAAGGLEKIPCSYVAQVAKSEFGLVATDFVAPSAKVEPEPIAEPEPVPEPEPEPVQVVEPEPIAKSEPEPEPVKVAKPVPEPVQVAKPVPELKPEPKPIQIAEPEPLPDPVIVFSDETDGLEGPVEEPELPELIQDTLPDLAILAPEVVASEPVLEEVVPELQPEPEPQPVQESVPSADSSPEDLPEWERDPTLAQLKPDLDALEKAMALAQGDADDIPELEPIGLAETPAPVAAPPEPEEIPEITLDNAIQSRIEDHLIDEPGQISPNAPETASKPGNAGDMPEIKIPPRKAKKADAELDKIAEELAKAKTIEDVDDKLAETLFGEEFSMIAAQVVAKAEAAESANDEELSLFDTQTNEIAQASGSAVPEVAESGVEVSLETPEQGGESGMDLSASQRLKTVRALNAHTTPTLQEAAAPPPEAASEPPARVATPESIEDQINTSMTQTLKALDVRPPISDHQPATRIQHDDDDDDEDDERSGFFSRFRRS